MPRPVHFEVSAENVERAIEFYRKAFGWRIEKWQGPVEYWLIMTGDEKEPGIDGGLMLRENVPAGTVNYIDVPDLDEYMARATSAGGTIVQPAMTVAGVGRMCAVMDPEGNVFGLMESERTE